MKLRYRFLIFAHLFASILFAQTTSQIDSVEEIYTNFRQKKTFSFSGNNFLSEKVTYSWNGNWFPNYKSSYIYDDAGNNIYMELSKIDDGVENSNRIYICKAEYDVANNIKSFFCQKGKDGEIEYEELYSYNNDGKMCYVIGELLHARQRELFQIMKCEYDDSACIKTLFRTNDKAMNPYRMEVQVSNGNGHLVWYELKYYNIHTQQWKQKYCESYQYDAMGRLILKKSSIAWIDRNPQSPTEHVFLYNDDGEIVEVMSYKTVNSHRTLESVISYEYDSRPSSEIIGRNSPYVMYSVDYDDIGNRIADVSYNELENKIVNIPAYNHKVVSKKYVSNTGSVYEDFKYHYTRQE